MAEQKDRIAFLKNALISLAKAVEDVSQGLINLETVIKRLKGETTQLSKNADKAAASMRKTAEETNKATTALKKNETQTKSSDNTNKGFFGNIGKNLKTIVSFYGAYQVLNLAISAFTDLTVGSAKRAIALEKALADLRAVAGLTSEDIEVLKGVVFEVAGVTSLTAIEVVELQKQLAKLGSSTEEIANLTKPIALLSQALGEDAGGVAAVLKKTLNQFQATSEEADKFANVLTGAVNETALSMNDLGTALGYVGPLGAQLGVSFEETAALLGILADNGFKASKAGTGLRSFFIAAAKDGRPFNEFLEDLGDSNLQAAESVETFGKVAASQVLVLSKNVGKYKELSDELRTSNRLFEANAVQMGSTEGQIQLLVSAYDRFSTTLGDVVTKTNVFVKLIKFLSPETAAQAKAFQILSNASDKTKGNFESLTEAMVGFGEGSEFSTTKAQLALRDLLVSSGTITKEQGSFLINQYMENGKTIQEYYEGLGGPVELAIRGIIDLGEERATILRDEKIAQAAVNDEYKAATEAVSNLRSEAAKGNLEDKDKEAILKRIQKSLEDTTKAYNESTDVDQRKVLEKRIALYEDLEKSVKGLDNSQDALDKKEQARLKELEEIQKANFKDELDRIKAELEAEVDRIKAVTDVELEGAKNSEEAAQIRLKQEKLVQAAYRNSVSQLDKLKETYPDFIEEIEKASGAYEKFVKFTQSDIGKEGITTLNDYKKEFEDLGKKLKEGKITLEQYEAQDAALQSSLLSSIGTLKDSTDANGELKEMLDRVVAAYLAAKKGAEDYTKSTKKEFDKITILGKDFAIDLTIEEAIGMSLATTADIIANFNDTALENTKNRLEAEKDEIANRYEVEQDILKSQLDNQIITESQYRKKQKELRKAQLAEENTIDKKIFDAEKKRDRQDATTGYLQALASIIPNLIVYDKVGNPVELSLKAALSSALATAAYGAELSAISQRQFFPRKFEKGGMVSSSQSINNRVSNSNSSNITSYITNDNSSLSSLVTNNNTSSNSSTDVKNYKEGGLAVGPSHAEGGIPFTVKGKEGFEMEGGEFIVNKRATAVHRELLERINGSYNTSAIASTRKFSNGGLVQNQVLSPNVNLVNKQEPTRVIIEKEDTESVDYLKAIAEATTSTAIGVSKPVRAYVSDKDLRNDSTERRLRDRNDRI